MKIEETFIGYSSVYDSIVKLHRTINSDGLTIKYYIEDNKGRILPATPSEASELLSNY